MSDKEKKILYIETGILLVTIPIAIIGWFRFFKLANEFIAYEKNMQEEYRNDDFDKELLIKYAELIKEKEASENSEKEYTKTIKSISNKTVLNKKAKDDDYVIVTLALTTCTHCNNFKPKAEEYAKSINYKYYWISLDEIEASEKQNLIALFPEYKGTPYTVIINKEKIAGSISGDVELEYFKSKMEEIIK